MVERIIDVIFIIVIFSIIFFWSEIKQFFFPSQRESIRKNNNYPRNRFYINHCWNCKSPINHQLNKMCNKCNYFFICNNCGKCYCDSSRYEKRI